jgi:hypothetical protein
MIRERVRTHTELKQRNSPRDTPLHPATDVGAALMAMKSELLLLYENTLLHL